MLSNLAMLGSRTTRNSAKTSATVNHSRTSSTTSARRSSLANPPTTLNKSTKQVPPAKPTTSRLSYSRVTPKTNQVSSPQQSSITLLQSRVLELENLSTTLVDQVKNLSELVTGLTQTVEEQQKVITLYEKSTEASLNGVSLDQELISNNIVIRGLEVSEETNEETLIETFEKICDQIGVERSEFKPVSAEIIRSRSKKKKPFVIRLPTRVIKQKFLQARRVKQDIRPSDIQFKQTTNAPLLITEQLTKENQKLFQEARTLRKNFKFVWTNQGQVLARRQKKSTVIRIRNSEDVDRLKAPNNANNRKSTQSRSQPRHNRTQS